VGHCPRQIPWDAPLEYPDRWQLNNSGSDFGEAMRICRHPLRIFLVDAEVVEGRELVRLEVRDNRAQILGLDRDPAGAGLATGHVEDRGGDFAIVSVAVVIATNFSMFAPILCQVIANLAR
jgi:hypothetical protein